MLKSFKELDKNEQYQLITKYIKDIENMCLALSESKFNTENKSKPLTLTIETTVGMIYTSKLSSTFKGLLVDEVNSKINLLKKNKTR